MADKPRPKVHEPEGQPGEGHAGETFDPMQVPQEPDSAESQHGTPRPSPGPHVPISPAEYERLKEEAKHKRLPHVPGQDDPARPK
jgi:hypothetical protein